MSEQKRFETFWGPDAVERGLILKDEVYDSDMRFVLIEFPEGESPRVVEWDGGEPEDQTFGRDLRWVEIELNKAYARGLKDGEEIGYSRGLKDGERDQSELNSWAIKNEYDIGYDIGYNDGYRSGGEDDRW